MPKTETGTPLAWDLPGWLANVYQPILPLLSKLKFRRQGSVDPKPGHIQVPQGYTVEVVTKGLQTPVHCCFDDQGNCYVSECGHKIDSPPRIVKVSLSSGAKEVVYTVPDERWIKTGALTGCMWHDGYVYFNNTDHLSRLSPDGQVQDLVIDLPGRGDHQTNHPLLGPDGKIYWGQGCVTNAGVVGSDDYAFEWLPRFPKVCDVPAKSITLTGQNFSYANVLGSVTESVQSGAYVPFGTRTFAGQIISGSNKPSGAIMRCDLDGSKLEVVAWGLRNPFSVAFHPDGRLFATEHGMDERGQRYILDDPDDLYEITPGEWYGWPDYASGIRMDDPHWGKGGQGRQPLIANPPNPNPPKPFASFATHEAANGFDFCHQHDFGFYGDAFVACFGDLAPITTLKHAIYPAGFKVVRVDMRSGEVHDFAVNRIAGPASKLPHDGFERPSHCAFGPDGALYVVDYGIIRIAPERGGIRSQMDSGVLWRIRRSDGPAGLLPEPPISVPLYLLQGLTILAGIVAALLGLRWLLRRRK